jgi:hypothetical protein
LKDQRLQPGYGMQACEIGTRCPLETVGFRQLREGPVDLPQQHRGRGGRTAATREFAIDDHDIQVLPREALGDQGSGNAAADDQRIAFHVLGDLEADTIPGCRKPRRAAAAQIGLFGIV